MKNKTDKLTTTARAYSWVYSHEIKKYRLSFYLDRYTGELSIFIRVPRDLILIISNDFRSLQENGRVEMVGVERLKHIPKNETIPIKTLFHINTLDASIFI